MSLTQRLIKALVPARWFAAMEAHSRSWVMRCPCGYETSIWEMGGIRYRAAGNPRIMGRCAKCGQRQFGQLHRIDLPEAPKSDAS